MKQKNNTFLSFADVGVTYSAERVRSKHFLGAHGLLSIVPQMSVVLCGAERGEILNTDIIDEEQKRELRLHAMSYTERVLITGSCKEAWLISPSLFPSATFCIAISPELSGCELCRLVKEDRSGVFLLSRRLNFKCARMTDSLRKKGEEMLALFDEIKSCFCDIYRLDRCHNVSEQRRVIAEQCAQLSYFTGCPIELELSASPDGYARTDLPLLTAFMLTVLMLARKQSPTRSARIEISSKDGAAYLKVGFLSEHNLALSSAMLEWVKTANDKGVYYSFDECRESVNIEFHPFRDDRRYLEIKQSFCFE